MKHQRIVNLKCLYRTCEHCQMLDKQLDEGVALYFCGDTQRELATDEDGFAKRSRPCLDGERRLKRAVLAARKGR